MNRSELTRRVDDRRHQGGPATLAILVPQMRMAAERAGQPALIGRSQCREVDRPTREIAGHRIPAPQRLRAFKTCVEQRLR